MLDAGEQVRVLLSSMMVGDGREAVIGVRITLSIRL